MNDSRIALVRAIGSGELKKAVAADEIAATAPEGFDASQRGAVAELVREWLGVTIETMPKQSKGQDKTPFGAGFGLLVSAVKSRLVEKGDTDWIRLAEQAAVNAHVKGEYDYATILGAVGRALEAAMTTEDAEAA
jgi:hypothetical protein